MMLDQFQMYGRSPLAGKAQLVFKIVDCVQVARKGGPSVPLHAHHPAYFRALHRSDIPPISHIVRYVPHDPAPRLALLYIAGSIVRVVPCLRRMPNFVRLSMRWVNFCTPVSRFVALLLGTSDLALARQAF